MASNTGFTSAKTVQRLVGYDNERGKGDHRHVLGHQLAYQFTSPDKLIADFLADVEEARTKR